MEIKETTVLDREEPLSKALSHLDTAPAVLVTKDGKYYGIIDHRSISANVRSPRNTKCETAIVRPPVLLEGTEVIERVSAFLLGHFKALPVINESEAPIGITTRVEALKEMQSEKLIPGGKVSELMSSPVFTVSEEDTIAQTKRGLRDKNARRMVVVSKGHPIGIVSDYDLSSWTGSQNFGGGRKDTQISAEKFDVDGMPIKGFLRPDITTIDQNESIENAVKRMIEKLVSSVIVVAGSKPVGILSALDIFKKVQNMNQERTTIHVSGLNENNKFQFENIIEKIGRVVEKFGESFNIRNVGVHTKERKSTTTVNLYFDTDDGHVSLRSERATLKEAVDEIAEELDKVLRRRKDRRPR